MAHTCVKQTQPAKECALPKMKSVRNRTLDVKARAVVGRGGFCMFCTFDVRYWPKADIPYVRFCVAIRGKADVVYCSAHVCF
jgi:hypothetical protein